MTVTAAFRPAVVDAVPIASYVASSCPAGRTIGCNERGDLEFSYRACLIVKVPATVCVLGEKSLRSRLESRRG
jgi:hypothetical protein